MMPIGPLTLAQLALKRNGCRLAALGRSGAISWWQRGDIVVATGRSVVATGRSAAVRR